MAEVKFRTTDGGATEVLHCRVWRWVPDTAAEYIRRLEAENERLKQECRSPQGAELASLLRQTTEAMANHAVVDFALWNRHCNACLDAAKRLEGGMFGKREDEIKLAGQIANAHARAVDAERALSEAQARIKELEKADTPERAGMVERVAQALAAARGVKIVDEVDQQLFERDARAAIQAMAEPTEAWRSTDGRLPEIGEPVLIHEPNARQPVKEALRLIPFEGGEARWYWSTPVAAGRGAMILPEHVPHWRPLPPPPAALEDQP